MTHYTRKTPQNRPRFTFYLMLLLLAVWTNTLVLAFVFQVMFLVGILWFAFPVILMGVFTSWHKMTRPKHLLPYQSVRGLLKDG